MGVNCLKADYNNKPTPACFGARITFYLFSLAPKGRGDGSMAARTGGSLRPKRREGVAEVRGSGRVLRWRGLLGAAPLIGFLLHFFSIKKVEKRNSWIFKA